MKFRILLRSFDNELMNLASQQLQSILMQTECNVKGVVALPTKLNVFVYFVRHMSIKILENISKCVYTNVLLILIQILPQF